MRNTTRLVVALVTGSMLLAAGSARAAELWAGPLNPAPAFLDCLAANVSKKPLEIQIEILSSTGVSVGGTTVTVAPGASSGIGAGVGNPRLCKFTFKGGKKSVRATACVSSDDRCDGAGVPAS
jgi:hypothetical protein